MVPNSHGTPSSGPHSPSIARSSAAGSAVAATKMKAVANALTAPKDIPLGCMLAEAQRLYFDFKDASSSDVKHLEKREEQNRDRKKYEEECDWFWIDDPSGGGMRGRSLPLATLRSPTFADDLINAIRTSRAGGTEQLKILSVVPFLHVADSRQRRKLAAYARSLVGVYGMGNAYGHIA